MNPSSLTPEQQQQQRQMWALLEREIAAAGGAIPFHRYMELALYAPGLGYYVAGASKFGEAGDFVTAPLISPLFSRCLGNQAAQVLEQVPGGSILEFGAGTGVMAADLLARLAELDRVPEEYLILEPSPELRQRQQQALAGRLGGLAKRVRWLDRLPERFRGLVVANEVLDAMPVQRFRKREGRVEELWVALESGRLEARWRPASPELARAVARIEGAVGALPDGYCSEVNPGIGPWIAALGALLEQGVVLLIDYGHERSVHYHPQRAMGTLRTHFRHQAGEDPLVLPGLQDITAHVDFTAVAEAADEAGLERLGYASQAGFLIGCGIHRLLAEADPQQPGYLDLAQGARRLLLPEGMGEQFKAMALGRGIRDDLMGFSAP